jgi:hypothetical protein
MPFAQGPPAEMAWLKLYRFRAPRCHYLGGNGSEARIGYHR